ncbi:MAG: DUF892 family protein [Verrucomicrobiota bacterium]
MPKGGRPPACVLAFQLGLPSVVDLLGQTLAEGKAAAEQLTDLAESVVNDTAMAASVTD